MTLLETLKAIDRPELLMLIKRDDDAKKVLIAWTCVHPPLFSAKEDAPIIQNLSLAEITNVAWKGYPLKKVPFEEMAILAGVPMNTVKLKWDQLRRAGMIYPDGTANEKALATIRGEVSAYIRGMVRWTKQK